MANRSDKVRETQVSVYLGQGYKDKLDKLRIERGFRGNPQLFEFFIDYFVKGENYEAQLAILVAQKEEIDKQINNLLEKKRQNELLDRLLKEEQNKMLAQKFKELTHLSKVKTKASLIENARKCSQVHGLPIDVLLSHIDTLKCLDVNHQNPDSY